MWICEAAPEFFRSHKVAIGIKVGHLLLTWNCVLRAVKFNAEVYLRLGLLSGGVRESFPMEEAVGILNMFAQTFANISRIAQ